MRRSNLARRRRRFVEAHRRAIAMVCLALAAAATAQLVTARPTPGGVSVVVARRDLPAGAQLTERDVRLAQWPADLVPAGVAARPVGKVLAGALRQGEPITDARLHGAGLLTAQPADTAAVALNIDPTLAPLIHSGDRVDLIAASATDSYDSQQILPNTPDPAAGGVSSPAVSQSAASRLAASQSAVAPPSPANPAANPHSAGNSPAAAARSQLPQAERVLARDVLVVATAATSVPAADTPQIVVAAPRQVAVLIGSQPRPPLVLLHAPARRSG